MDSLETFLQTCQRHPSAVMPLTDFAATFRAQLSPDLQASWRRTRIVARLTELGYRVGVLDHSKVAYVAGLATGSWTASGGRLTLSA